MFRKTTSERLQEIMEERNLKQIDILNLAKPFCEKYNIKMNKSDISQYLSGKSEPNQDKLAILGMALNVNEVWLMGFNVMRDRLPEYSTRALSITSNLTSHETKVIAAYRNQPELQPAVDRLLNISEEDDTKQEHVNRIPVAAFHGNGVETIEITDEELKKIDLALKKLGIR